MWPFSKKRSYLRLHSGWYRPATTLSNFSFTQSATQMRNQYLRHQPLPLIVNKRN